MKQRPKDETLVADYPVIELAGETRLILGLGDDRMFGIELAKPLKGSLPKRARVKMASLDEAGVPQGAEFVDFL